MGSVRQFYGAQLEEPKCPFFLANSLTAWAQARFALQQNRKYEPLIEPLDYDALDAGDDDQLLLNGNLKRCASFANALNPQPGKAYEVNPRCWCQDGEDFLHDYIKETYSKQVRPAFARAVCAVLEKNPRCLSTDKTLALCMSQQFRLGQCSFLSSLSSDLLRRIITKSGNFDSGQSSLLPSFPAVSCCLYAFRAMR